MLGGSTFKATIAGLSARAATARDSEKNSAGRTAPGMQIGGQEAGGEAAPPGAIQDAQTKHQNALISLVIWPIDASDGRLPAHHKHAIVVIPGDQRLLLKDAQGLFAQRPPMLWRGGHDRWDVENDCFNTLDIHFGLDHCYKHAPLAIVNFVLTLFLAYVLLQCFWQRNVKPALRKAIATLIGLTGELRHSLYARPLVPAACRVGVIAAWRPTSPPSSAAPTAKGPRRLSPKNP
jgi:hypothetical protein